MSGLANWWKDNQALAILLITQAIVGGAYLVNLEARVSILEDRGSPHLAEINTRLTVLEGATKKNERSIERMTDIMTKELHIAPTRP
jgi:hypothetical protein